MHTLRKKAFKTLFFNKLIKKFRYNYAKKAQIKQIKVN